MTVQMVLLPVFVLVFLTLGLFFWTGRRDAVARSDAADATNHASQLDLLFYTLIAIGLPLRKIDLALVCLSWVFVVTRFLHAGIYIAGNSRSQAWLAGALVLLAMWFYFALRMLLLI
ncbi:MAPEG family protein [Tardiphaga sp.]|uniref:MAPEG family protein n=1 Tax=Tardiphaga sp. TaxID=1926292 RepID=UPI00261C3AB8|nr:MAPEG family protein [Tardiphaga sp.]MDB5618373.1 hypothetical protein [Tardiphaga sp.]